MIDIVREIDSVRRETGEGATPAGAGRFVRLQRDFDSPIEDVWDAFTNPTRVGRWFLPISGDYRLGGRYQFEGNAGGEILACEQPTYLKATWIFGEQATEAPSSIVEVRLSSVSGGTRVDFLHTAVVPEDQWPVYGPGAVGVGWDGGMLGLALHLRGGSVADPAAWMVSDEGRAFYKRCSEAWGEANVAAGADPEVAAQGVANTIQFYAPDPTPVS